MRENCRIILFEAYDEPWKRQWEGTVGGYWGLFDGKRRTMKYPPGLAVSNYPFWKLQLGGGLALNLSVFAVAGLALRHRPKPPRLIAWIAVTLSAITGGILLGVSAENMVYQSYGLFGWLGRGSLLATSIAAPLLSSNALMTGRALPTFLAVC
jgi:hypothetical protein